jgi:hypothetical protein
MNKLYDPPTQDPESRRRVFREGCTPKTMFPLVRDLAAEGFPVRLACGVLGFSPQAFYKWQAQPVSDRDWADAHTINVIVDVHADDPEFGYRFIADELEDRGQRSCERRVWRLCRAQRVWSTTTKKGRRGEGKTPGRRSMTTSSSGTFTGAAPDLDQLWITDITEHPTVEAKLYICSIRTCARTGSSATRSPNA